MSRYLELDDALYIIEKFGFYMRDAGLLASALARPATSLFGSDAYSELPLKAAALLESLARNHPFADGNKRTAWTLMALFLWINGSAHDFTTDEAYALVIGVASGTIGLTESSLQITAHLVDR